MTPEQLKRRLQRLISAGVITNKGAGRPPTTGAAWLAEQANCNANTVYFWLSGRSAITDTRAEQLEKILSEAEATQGENK